MGREVTRTHAEGPTAESRPALPRHIEPAQRIWLHDGGKPMFGPGTLRLLVLVTQTGSLHQAAKKTGMAYSKAWRIVKEAEDHLGFKLLERQIGGAGGGGSTLTADAQRLVARFVAMRAEAEANLRLLFRKYFGEEPFAALRDPE
jgi:molybdate transport system regulatory protein